LLTLDDDELRAVAALLNASPGPEAAASVAVGKVRLQARGLLTGPRSPGLDDAVAEALRTCLWAEDRLSVDVVSRTAEGLNVTFYRRGTREVVHSCARVPDGELHTFASVGDVPESLMGLLHAPAQAHAFTPQVLEVHALEQARQAAAAGDRQAMATALQDAGGDARLTSQLVEAFMAADTLARLTRSGEISRSVTVLSSRGEVWTFATEGQSSARVGRPSAEALRHELQALWAT